MRDLEGEYESLFSKGPGAVEFLGKKANQPWAALEDAAGGVQQLTSNGGGGGGGGSGEETRFFSRAAIVFWPRSRRCAEVE